MPSDFVREITFVPATLDTHSAGVYAELSTLRAENDRLKMDAKRYRFLRGHPEWMGWEHDFRADEIDQAVDAEMAKTHNVPRNRQAPDANAAGDCPC